MRFAILLVLVLVFAVLNQGDAWPRFRIRIRWRRVRDFVKRAAAKWAIGKGLVLLGAGKRDVSEIDTNMDGIVDQQELEQIMSRRDAENFLELLSEDGSSKIRNQDFERMVRELNENE